MTSQERTALVALVAIGAVTAVWWALALWPMPAETPYWLVRTREVCFGSLPDTLPSRAGWILLIGEPLTMLTALVVLWPSALSGAFASLARRSAGRVALACGALLLVAGAAAASARVTTVSRRGDAGSAWVAPPPDTYPRLDRPAPPLGLVNQRGDTVSLASLRGRPALITFAYAHCMSICPDVVRQVLGARTQLAGSGMQAVVVTIDPWRDTPARLPTVAAEWQLGDSAHVLSGDTTAVLRVLEAWNVPHGRDSTSGEIAHPSLVYLLDGNGTIVYAATARRETIVALARRSVQRQR